jgi:hypothetical protein
VALPARGRSPAKRCRRRSDAPIASTRRLALQLAMRDYLIFDGAELCDCIPLAVPLGACMSVPIIAP